MKPNSLIRRTFVIFSLTLSFSIISWNLCANQFAFAADEEERANHGDHDDQAKEEKHEHDHDDQAKEEKHEHGHDDQAKEEKHEHGHDESEEEEGTRFGAGKAITAANKKDGIQLSEKAIQTLGLSYIDGTGEGTFKLPLKTAVFFQDEVGVYRLKNGWHKLIEVQLISRTANEVVVKAMELKSGDQIAKDGVPLLRAAELEAWGGSGDGHGH